MSKDEFIRTIANMTKDGEEVGTNDDWEWFEIDADNAIETLNRLIDEARKVT